MVQVYKWVAVKTCDNEDSDDDESNDDAEEEEDKNDDVEDNDDGVKITRKEGSVRLKHHVCRGSHCHTWQLTRIMFEFEMFITSCQHSVLYVVSHKPTNKSFNP